MLLIPPSIRIRCVHRSAANWWPALLLTVLNTALPPKVLLSVAMEDYRQHRLSVGLITYELHPRAVAAIEGLSHRARLFPWPWSLPTLTTRLEQLVALAVIPSVSSPFEMRRLAAWSELNQLDLSAGFASLFLH